MSSLSPKVRPPLTVITASSVTELEFFCFCLWVWAGLGGFFVGIFSNQEGFFLSSFRLNIFPLAILS